MPPQGSGGTLCGECSSSLCLLEGSRPRPTPPEQQVPDPLEGSSWLLLLLLPCPYLELIIQNRTNRRSSHLCHLFLSRWRGVTVAPWPKLEPNTSGIRSEQCLFCIKLTPNVASLWCFRRSPSDHPSSNLGTAFNRISETGFGVH